jgi:hypothetical protein
MGEALCHLGTGGVHGALHLTQKGWRALACILVALWRKMRQKEILMPPLSSSFASVKLSSGLVNQAREAASPMRRSVAGQIEYWATLGRIAETSGLTVLEAREAIARYDVRQLETGDTDPLDALQADFLAAESSGRLVQAVRQLVQKNRREVVKAA